MMMIAQNLKLKPVDSLTPKYQFPISKICSKMKKKYPACQALIIQ